MRRRKLGPKRAFNAPVEVSGLAPLVFRSVAPPRTSALTVRFSAIHLAVENGTIAFGRFADGINVPLFSSSVVGCRTHGPGLVTPIAERKNERVPEPACGR